MTLQKQVKNKLGFGAEGDFYDNSPRRVDNFLVYGKETQAQKATGYIEFLGNVTNGDTLTLGTQTYTFKTTLSSSTAENEVLIGANATATATNLKNAIIGGSGSGTTYGSNTPVNISASATATNITINLEALTAGIDGNNITLATSVIANIVLSGNSLNGGENVGYINGSIGRVFSINPNDSKKVVLGNEAGINIFAGILVNKNEYSNYNNFKPTLELKDATIGAIAKMGRIIVRTENVIGYGYVGIYSKETGQISGIEAGDSVPSGYLEIPNSIFISEVQDDGLAVLQITN
ncbi:MAG: hypothetical protein LBF97_04325 [Elusimicrobiota bacterium]|jgi:hypothetical protein|nr:hypothetical protein [Elusimicrobiota bacterium]